MNSSQLAKRPVFRRERFASTTSPDFMNLAEFTRDFSNALRCRTPMERFFIASRLFLILFVQFS